MITAHRALFPEWSLARKQFATVATAVKELEGFAVKRMLTRREGRASKTAARQALRERIEALALTARAIAQTAPGLEDKFRLPSSLPDRALITQGRLFAQELEAFKADFLAHAAPKTFIADLVALVDAFEQASAARQNIQAESTAVRASIRNAIATGSEAVLRIDAMVKNHLGGDESITALWRRDRRIGPRRRTSTVDAVPEPAPTSAAPGEVPAALLAPVLTTTIEPGSAPAGML